MAQRDEQGVEVSVRFEGGDAVAGSLQGPDGSPLRFEGLLELLSAVEAVLAGRDDNRRGSPCSRQD